MKNITLRLSIYIALVFCFNAAVPVVSTAAEWSTKANLRERVQSFDNFDFNDSVIDDKVEWNTRFQLNSTADFGGGLKLHLQPQFIYTETHFSAPNTVDTTFKQADLYKAHLKYDRDALYVKLGRQTLVYGDQRLLGHLGWKDVSRTFDGILVGHKTDKYKADLFHVSPADIGAMGSIADGSDSGSGESLTNSQNTTLTGLYMTYNFIENLSSDFYYINWTNNSKVATDPKKDVNTYGFRLFGKWQSLDYTFEHAFQDGDWDATTDQDAVAVALKAGYTMDKWKTRLGVEYDHSPGDSDSTDTTHETFVFPFHTNHMHYGEMDLFSWANMKDLSFNVKTSPKEGLTLFANYHILELDEATDDWLNVVGTGVVNATYGPGDAAYKETDAGTELKLKAVYKVKAIDNLKVALNYSIFSAGDAVKERNGGKADDAEFMYFLASYVF